MSYYQRHIFFCCNQRENGARCCNDSGAQAIRDYAKNKVKELKLSGPGKVRINNSGRVTGTQSPLIKTSRSLLPYGNLVVGKNGTSC